MRRKGFTLVEVLIVVIIIGILAAIGVPQFAKAVERSRIASINVALGQIRTVQQAYYTNHFNADGDQVYTEDTTYVKNQIDLDETHWAFTLNDVTETSTWQITATRQAGTYAGQTYIIDKDGNIDGASTYQLR